LQPEKAFLFAGEMSDREAGTADVSAEECEQTSYNCRPPATKVEGQRR